MKDKIIGKWVKYKNRIKHSAENFLASKIKKNIGMSKIFVVYSFLLYFDTLPCFYQRINLLVCNVKILTF